jgi:hypothetical protein
MNLIILLSLLPLALALYVEEAGLNDFTLSSTGHGVPSAVFSTQSSIITSDNSCTVASRSIQSGKFQWRRHVCSSYQSSHTIQMSGSFFFTADRLLIRSWSLDSGTLIWETQPLSSAVELLGIVSMPDERQILAYTSDNGCTIHFSNAVNGRSLGSVASRDVEASSNLISTWLKVFFNNRGGIMALFGIVDSNGITKGDLILVSFDIHNENIIAKGTKLSHLRDPLLASSLQVHEDEGSAITQKGKLIQFSILSTKNYQNIDLTLPPWKALSSIASFDGNLIQVLNRDDNVNPPRLATSMYLLKENGGLSHAEISHPARLIAYCDSAKLLLLASTNQLHVYTFGSFELVPLNLDLNGFEDVISLETVTCEAGSMSALATTSKLVSSVVKVTDSSIRITWTTEDGLSTVTSALMIDTSVALQTEKSSIMDKLHFMARLEAQATTSLNILSHLAVSETRDDDFGFVKMAILMSQTLHCIWAIPTLGENRGTVAWKLDLPVEASSHALVHGTATSASMVHGINGGTQMSHVLVLSFVEKLTQWHCLDAVTGSVHSGGSVDALASVVQVIPLAGDGLCRQKAVLIHHDRSVTFIPDDEVSKKVISDMLRKTGNGFYTHIVDRESNRIEAFKLVKHQSGFHVKLVGLTDFVGEKIVKLAYPKRDESIQSPCNIVGDGSILLKYLNPHIAVIVSTMAEPVQNQNKDPIVAAIRLKQTNSGVKKPKGVSPPGDLEPKSQSEDPSNLFVNVIDTVSGRILHRVAHSNVATNVDIQVLINENWIIYAIYNDKSRRTELGVLNLYEGMIDKAGITAFTSPEQVLSFSSLDPRESRPVVLSKTYTIVKPVTALGVTASRAGISTQQILIATGDDRILTVSRQVLEPRRPTGKEKPHEKEEGLIQYHPLVPLTTLSSPSYNQTIHGVTSIISASTALESQSLILAFGGPDIFFARISPSNGFDLLPESFSRTLLSSVVVVLLLVYLVVKRMSERKAILQAWA